MRLKRILPVVGRIFLFSAIIGGNVIVIPATHAAPKKTPDTASGAKKESEAKAPATHPSTAPVSKPGATPAAASVKPAASPAAAPAATAPAPAPIASPDAAGRSVPQPSAYPEPTKVDPNLPAKQQGYTGEAPIMNENERLTLYTQWIGGFVVITGSIIGLIIYKARPPKPASSTMSLQEASDSYDGKEKTEEAKPGSNGTEPAEIATADSRPDGPSAATESAVEPAAGESTAEPQAVAETTTAGANEPAVTEATSTASNEPAAVASDSEKES